mgnify:CR=1 FL=1
MTIIQKHPPYRFGSTDGLSRSQMDILAAHFSRPPAACPGRSLSGRTGVHRLELAPFGPVVIKHYFRGGLIRHFNRRTYLGVTGSRSRSEFELLARLRKIGVNAPEPVAFASRGRLLYQAWLITKQIPDVEPLAETCGTDPDRAGKAMMDLIPMINRLISHGIWHVDLHPGNVLVNKDAAVYLIDFDNAKTGQSCLNRIRDRYAARWRRAVQKYGLPAFVDEMMQAGLYSKKNSAGRDEAEPMNPKRN